MKSYASIFLAHVFCLIPWIGNCQPEIVTIDGIYIERDTVDATGKPHAASFRINEKPVMDEDVIVFDIPGFEEYLESSNLTINDVKLLIEDVVMSEMPAFIENAESGIVRFQFNEDDLSSDHRQKLYNRRGGAVKKMRLGIKAGDETIINYSPKADFYFAEIDTWERVGLFLILAFVLTFSVVIIVFPTILKETVPTPFRAAFTNLVKPDIDKLLPKPPPDAIEESLPPGSVPEKRKHVTSLSSAQHEFHQFMELSKIKLAYSFSKSQLVFWTLIVISSFIYIWAMTNDFNPLNTTALILLGISSATSAAGSIVNDKQAAKALSSVSELPKSAGKKESASEEHPETVNISLRPFQAFLESRVTENNYFKDILSDNQGISIHRVQAFAFNIVFGIIFLKSVVLDYTIPVFEEAELLLLGISNGTYTFLKSSETT